MKKTIASRMKWHVAALAIILTMAAFFRLYHPGVSSFRADTIHFFNFYHKPESGRVIFASL